METNLENKLSLKEKLLNFFNSNRLKIYVFLTILLGAAVSVIIIDKNSDKKNNIIAEKYIQAGIFLSLNKTEEAKLLYEEIVLSKNNFYSILALNSIIEKNLISDKEKILKYFSIIKELDYSDEKSDLIILKNALYLIKNNEDELGKKYLEELIEKESKLKVIAQEIIND